MVRTALALAGVVTLLGADAAWAGTMHVYSCHTPTGRVVGTGGWTTTSTSGFNTCATGDAGALRVSAIYNNGVGGKGSWSLSAPGDALITFFSAAVCGHASNANGYAMITWPLENSRHADTMIGVPPKPARLRCLVRVSTVAPCGQLRSPFTLDVAYVVRRRDQLRHANCFPGLAEMAIGAFKAHITDPKAPSVSGVQGALATNANHSGVERLVLQRDGHRRRRVSRVRAGADRQQQPVAGDRLDAEEQRHVRTTRCDRVRLRVRQLAPLPADHCGHDSRHGHRAPPARRPPAPSARRGRRRQPHRSDGGAGVPGRRARREPGAWGPVWRVRRARRAADRRAGTPARREPQHVPRQRNAHGSQRRTAGGEFR